VARIVDVAQAMTSDPIIRAAGGFAIVSGILSVFGIIFLITMFALFGRSNMELGGTFGLLNDIIVALQYLLSIPVAIALYRILSPYNPLLIRAGTIIGIVSILAVIILQLALVFEVLTFQQQALWISLFMLLGIGSWLVITGLVARSTEQFPNSVLMSSIAVPYFGFPVWAIWLGRILLKL
jgi:hypothetical protein